MYGLVPPVALAVAVPVLPLQLVLVVVGAATKAAVGCVSTPVAVAEQVLLSVTVTV